VFVVLLRQIDVGEVVDLLAAEDIPKTTMSRIREMHVDKEAPIGRQEV